MSPHLDRPRSPLRARVALAFLAVLLAGCTGKQVAGVPTDAGLGDPYFPDAGNPGYQVEQYDLRVRYDPDTDELTGTVDIDAVATADLATLRLDLVGLAVDEVTVDGAAATHDTAADKLTVELPAAASAGDQLQVAVDYGGVPEPLGSPQLGSNGFHHTDDGAFAVGQPDSARTWFPVNDHPRDKAVYTIEAAVPEGLAAVSNGVPRGRDTADGWTTWRWAERTPMASYLATLAIGEYRVDEWEHDDGRPVVTAVQAELPREVDEQLAQTPQIADVLAQWFGPYPVDAYGGIALSDRRIGFALETQSRPVYGPSFFVQGQSGEVRDGTWVIVHELAHQWFGNSVSVHEWREIWLNEGFATYAEWLWEEHDGGDTVQESFDLYWKGPGAEEQFWQVPPGDPGPDRLFASPVYVRGAMALHALRLAVGDDDFFRILQEWAQEQRDDTATTAELVTLAERVSGEPLQELFDEWLYRTERPPHPS